MEISSVASGLAMQQIGSRDMAPNGFARADEDDDGSLNLSEFEAVVDKVTLSGKESIDTEEVFATYDADGDGVWSKEEADTAMESLREQYGAPPPPPPEGAQATDETSEESSDLTALLSQEEDETDDATASIIDMLNSYSTNAATATYSVVDYLA